MTTTTREQIRRYVIVDERTGRIVAATAGTHRMLERFCARLDYRHGGSFFYDDVSERGQYLPQIGPNLALSSRGGTR